MGFDRSALKNDFGDPAGEARACRQESALFDFSFLDSVRLQGPDALAIVEAFVQRPLAALPQGAIAYALRTNSNGTIVSDLTVWRSGADIFDVMSGRQQDIADLMARNSACVEITDLEQTRAVFAVQGPLALEALGKLGCTNNIADLAYFKFAQTEIAGTPCTVGRVGYTGEAGFEIVFPRSESPRMWRHLAEHSRPSGFVAADALRIEAGFVLFANEFKLPVSPAEVGLQHFCAARNVQEPALKLVCFQGESDQLALPWASRSSIARPVEPGIIAITSACNSIVAGGLLGLGFVTESTAADAMLHDPAGEFRKIRQVPRPFYDELKRRPRAAWR